MKSNRAYSLITLYWSRAGIRTFTHWKTHCSCAQSDHIWSSGIFIADGFPLLDGFVDCFQHFLNILVSSPTRLFLTFHLDGAGLSLFCWGQNQAFACFSLPLNTSLISRPAGMYSWYSLRVVVWAEVQTVMWSYPWSKYTHATTQPCSRTHMDEF